MTKRKEEQTKDLPVFPRKLKTDSFFSPLPRPLFPRISGVLRIPLSSFGQASGNSIWRMTLLAGGTGSRFLLNQRKRGERGNIAPKKKKWFRGEKGGGKYPTPPPPPNMHGDGCPMYRLESGKPPYAVLHVRLHSVSTLFLPASVDTPIRQQTTSSLYHTNSFSWRNLQLLCR